MPPSGVTLLFECLVSDGLDSCGPECSERISFPYVLGSAPADELDKGSSESEENGLASEPCLALSSTYEWFECILLFLILLFYEWRGLEFRWCWLLIEA